MARSARKAAIGSLAALGMIAALTMPALATPGEEHKQTICHATHSETNPYVQITVDYAAIDGEKNNDHSHHLGPVWYSGAKADGVDWGDIIPPTEGVNPGQNWEDGEAIWLNDCQVPEPQVVEPPGGGGVLPGNPTPTPPGGGVLGGNPTPTPAPLPDTAMGTGVVAPTAVLGVLLLASLLAMASVRIFRTR